MKSDLADTYVQSIILVAADRSNVIDSATLYNYTEKITSSTRTSKHRPNVASCEDPCRDVTGGRFFLNHGVVLFDTTTNKNYVDQSRFSIPPAHLFPAVTPIRVNIRFAQTQMEVNMGYRRTAQSLRNRPRYFVFNRPTVWNSLPSASHDSSFPPNNSTPS